jgi:hypothetical protein
LGQANHEAAKITKIFPAREGFLRTLDDFFATFAPSRFITLPKNGYNQPDRAAGRGHF